MSTSLRRKVIKANKRLKSIPEMDPRWIDAFIYANNLKLRLRKSGVVGNKKIEELRRIGKIGLYKRMRQKKATRQERIKMKKTKFTK